MRKYLLILLCLCSFCSFSEVFTESKTVSGGPWYFSYGSEYINFGAPDSHITYGYNEEYELTSCDFSSDAGITLESYSCAGDSGYTTVYLKMPFSGDNWDPNMTCTVTLTWTIKTCPDRSDCILKRCPTCSAFYCERHDIHTCSCPHQPDCNLVNCPTCSESYCETHGEHTCSCPYAADCNLTTCDHCGTEYMCQHDDSDHDCGCEPIVCDHCAATLCQHEWDDHDCGCVSITCDHCGVEYLCQHFPDNHECGCFF